MTLYPGSVLYLPPLWVHDVEALDTSLSLSMWLDSEEWDVMDELDRVPLPFEAEWGHNDTQMAALDFLVRVLTRIDVVSKELSSASSHRVLAAVASRLRPPPCAPSSPTPRPCALPPDVMGVTQSPGSPLPAGLDAKFTRRAAAVVDVLRQYATHSTDTHTVSENISTFVEDVLVWAAGSTADATRLLQRLMCECIPSVLSPA